MKKNFKDTLLFLLIGTALFILLSFANKIFIIKPLYASKNFKLDDQVQTLFCGASLAAFAFNPEVIPGSCNVGLPAETSFYTYYKLMHILKGNPQIKTVILPYAFARFSKKQDEDLIDPKKTPGDYNRYFMLLDKEGRQIIQRLDFRYIYALMRWHLGFPFEAHQNLHLFFKAIFNRPNATEYPFWGGFQKKNIEQLEFFHRFKQDRKKGVNLALARHYPGEGDTLKASSMMINSLKKITQLCKDKNIRLILIITPLHEDYFTRVPAYYKKLNAATLKDLKAIYSDLEFYDYTRFFTQDEYFLDCDHLSRAGANIFSDMIYKKLLFQNPFPK